MPEAGRTGSAEANSSSSISPDQNTGAEKPNSATLVTSAPSQLDGRRAAVTPRKVPSAIASASAENTSSTVAGTRSRIRSSTGRLK